MFSVKKVLSSVVIMFVFWGCTNQIEFALKKIDGLNYLSVHDLEDRVNFDQTAKLPQDQELLSMVGEAKSSIYGILNKTVCSGSEEYLKKSLFSFTPNQTATNIEFPFHGIFDENKSCVNVTQIDSFQKLSNNELQFTVAFASIINKNVIVDIKLIKEDSRWCLKSLLKR